MDDAGQQAAEADPPVAGENGQRAVIEAKGEISHTGVDFRTGLGQLHQGMTEPGIRYGLAIPDTPKVEAQRGRIPDWVRSALGLGWILVKQAGEPEVVKPGPRGG